jgi:hypothetical protein
MAGQHNIPITIADILIQVQSPLSASELGIEARLGDFFGAAETPVAKVSLRWEESDVSPCPQGDLIYDPGSIWRMYRTLDEYYAAIGYPEVNGSAGVQAVLKANPLWDDLTLTEHRRGSSWQSLLNIGAGELILRTSILFTDGLVFHASGIDDNGRGIVFVGHAGAGKSTQAGFWSEIPGAVAMNDDRIAVRSNASSAICYGTPWGGTADIARNHHAALAAIILLEQAPENFIEPINSTVSAPMLLARAFVPYWDKELMDRAFTNLNELLTRVPVYRLHCRPEPEVISLVRSVL